MAKLNSRSSVHSQKVYDVTTEGTHSFFAASGPTPERGVLVHNSHQLSKQALDALLKPLEENLQGSSDKKLVCFFCTTEPEKMRETILSRCAPAFIVKALSPAIIAERLEHICKTEGYDYEPEVLPLLAEMSECHVRDSIKAVEGVALLGGVNRANITAYLHLDLHGMYLGILEGLGSDGALGKVLTQASEILTRVSPGIAYKRLCEAALLGYQVHLGVAKVPGYWEAEKVHALGERGNGLLLIAERLSRIPSHPTASMVLCDLSVLHHWLQGNILQPQAQSASVQVSTAVVGEPSEKPVEKIPSSGMVSLDAPALVNGVSIDPRGVRRLKAVPVRIDDPSSFELSHHDFAMMVGKMVAELGRTGSS